VFRSALDAVTGGRSALGLRPKRRILVVLVDGMGAENVLARAGHAPWLAREISAGGTTLASFPATTSSNIAGFATGLMPGDHGFIGHVVQDAHFGERLNLLNGWNEKTDARLWQPNQTVSELASQRGVSCNVIAAEEYRSTGFTQATMREANFYGVDGLRERFDKALEILSRQEESINYLYVPELDKLGHVNGWQSPGWAMQLEVVAAEIDRLVKRLPSDSGLIVTADHGMIDSLEDQKIELSETFGSIGVDFFGGDTRTSLVYLKDQVGASEAKRFLGESRFFSVYSPDELSSWYGEFGPQAINRLPDLVLIAKSDFTLYHEGFSKPKSYRMIAHHGAMTSAELKIPLIRVGV
jgi:hypothetical protein